MSIMKNYDVEKLVTEITRVYEVNDKLKIENLRLKLAIYKTLLLIDEYDSNAFIKKAIITLEEAINGRN